MQVYLGQILEASLDGVEGIESIVVQRREVEPEKSSEPVEVSGGSFQSDQSANTVASESRCGDPMVVHESHEVVSHGLVIKVFDIVGVAKVSWIDDPDIPVVENLVSEIVLDCFCLRRR